MTNWMPDLTQLPIAATLLAKLTVLLAAAWLLHALLSARNPRRRVLLWRLALGGVLLLLAGEAVLPRLSVAVPASWMAPGGGRDLRANPALAQSDERTRPATGGGPATALARAAAAGGAPALAAATPGRRLGLGSLAASAEESASAAARWLAQRPSRWLAALWAAGALVLAVRLGASYYQLRRLVRRARPAPESAGALLGQMAERMGLGTHPNTGDVSQNPTPSLPASGEGDFPAACRERDLRCVSAEGDLPPACGGIEGGTARGPHETRGRNGLFRHTPKLALTLRVADGRASPFVTGWLRPTIVLPAAMVEERHRALLPGIFAHELSHLAAGDLGWMLLGRWVGVALWFHPLAWGMRRAHDAACEEVCDGVAAQFAGGAPAYSQVLARAFLELAAETPHPIAASMIRPAEIVRRIRRLRAGLLAPRLSRSWVVVSLLAALLGVGILGGLKIVAAGPVEKARGTAPLEKRADASPIPTPTPNALDSATGVKDEAAKTTATVSLQFRWVATDAQRDEAEQLPWHVMVASSHKEPDLWVLKDVIFSEKDIASYDISPPQQGGSCSIVAQLDNSARGWFAQITGENVRRQFAMVLNGQVLSAPTLQNKILSGQMYCGTLPSLAEAKSLVQSWGGTPPFGADTHQVTAQLQFDRSTPEAVRKRYTRVRLVKIDPESRKQSKDTDGLAHWATSPVEDGHLVFHARLQGEYGIELTGEDPSVALLDRSFYLPQTLHLDNLAADQSLPKIVVPGLGQVSVELKMPASANPTPSQVFGHLIVAGSPFRDRTLVNLETRSDPQEIAPVVAGEYDLSLGIPGFSVTPKRQHLAVRTGKTTAVHAEAKADGRIFGVILRKDNSAAPQHVTPREIVLKGPSSVRKMTPLTASSKLSATDPVPNDQSDVAYESNFRFVNLQAGTYDLTIQADGYQDYHATYQVVPGVAMPQQQQAIFLEPGQPERGGGAAASTETSRTQVEVGPRGEATLPGEQQTFDLTDPRKPVRFQDIEVRLLHVEPLRRNAGPNAANEASDTEIPGAPWVTVELKGGGRFEAQLIRRDDQNVTLRRFKGRVNVVLPVSRIEGIRPRQGGPNSANYLCTLAARTNTQVTTLTLTLFESLYIDDYELFAQNMRPASGDAPASLTLVIRRVPDGTASIVAPRGLLTPVAATRAPDRPTTAATQQTFELTDPQNPVRFQDIEIRLRRVNASQVNGATEDSCDLIVRGNTQSTNLTLNRLESQRVGEFEIVAQDIRAGDGRAGGRVTLTVRRAPANPPRQPVGDDGKTTATFSLQFRWVAADDQRGKGEQVGWDDKRRPKEEKADLWLLPEVLMTQDDVASVGSYPDSTPAGSTVFLKLTAEGTKRFAALTEQGLRRRLAIVLNGIVLTAPTIMSKIPNGAVQISGLSKVDADGLVASIRAANPAVAIAAQAEPVFGPVEEQVLRQTGEDCMVDFDKGRLITSPVGLQGTEKWLEWAAENGVDAGAGGGVAPHSLIGMDLIIAPRPNETWDTETARNLLADEVFRVGKAGNPVYMSAEGKLPVTYAFKTREGGIGLVQILEFMDQEPRGTKIRYKMVLRPDATPLPAASDPTTQTTGEGVRLWQEGKLPEAEKKFLEAVVANPKDADAWNGLGWARFRQGASPAAKDAFEKCIALDPQQAGALNGLGWIAKADGKTDEAIARWNQAIEAVPNATAALSGLATTYMEKERYELAAGIYEKWLQAEPNNTQVKADLERAKSHKPVVALDDLPHLIQELSNPSAPRFEALNRIVQAGSPAVPALIEEMKTNGNWQIPKALGAIGDKRAIEPLIEKLEKNPRWSPMREVVGEALTLLTGQKLEPDAKAWREWWNKNGKSATPKEPEILLEPVGAK